MELPVSAQALDFFTALAAGVGVGIIYDIFRLHLS